MTSGRRARGTEPAWPIRLLALDIDGTLIGPDLVLRERTHAAVVAALRHGVRVSLVTGRMATSALPIAEALGLTDPIVAYQGALIRAMPDGPSRPDAPHGQSRPRGSGRLPARPPGPVPWIAHGRRRPVGRLLRHRPLPADIARSAIAWSRDHGLDPHINHLERFILRADDPRADDYSAFLGARAELVPDIEAAVAHPVTKVIAVGDEPWPMRLLPDARRAFAGRADVTVSHPRFLEFVALGVSKGMALAWLARRAGVPLGQAMAVGDSLNDLEMVELAGHGVAMPSAPPALRAVARYLAPPLEDEGLAQVIEALVLVSPRTAVRTARRLAAEAADARADQAAFVDGAP